MIVVCENCHKKYRIYPEKMGTDEASFNCEVCQHRIMVARPLADPLPVGDADPDPRPATAMPALNLPSESVPPAAPAAQAEKSRVVLGLRSKMLFLFLAIPILIMILAAGLYLRQLNALSDLITEESSQAIQKMGEDKVIDASRSVALQCKLFLESHPFLEKEMLNNNMEFRRLAVQKVGQTGYTSLYQLPGVDDIWRAWAHFDQAVIGQDLTEVRKAMGVHLAAFMKIFDGVRSGAESEGYFDFPEKDTLRRKFLVCTPVVGTPYVIAATTFMDEFEQPVKRMQTRAKKITDRTRNVITLIVVGSLILIGLIVFLYSYRLTDRIRTLTRIADEISVGDLDATVRVGTKDEIGRLAEAIARMQDSIRMSIERLRKRR
jgi:predicted Zn finger-like uncharacterized protein